MSKPLVAFVTGVSSGIGRATAKQFADREHVVFGSVPQVYANQTKIPASVLYGPLLGD